MTRDLFLDSPWKNPHPSYDESPFNIRPAPEFATAEVVVASLYRALGFKDAPEGSVPKSGKEFDRITQNPTHSARVGSKISNDTWRTVLHGVLDSPKQPNQSAKRFLQLCPIVPDVALYSGSARLAGNSWNPGQLIQRMVVLGSDSASAAQARWKNLFSAMTVGSEDDLWALWLEREFVLRRSQGVTWEFRAIGAMADLPEGEKRTLSYPAQQFVKDLDAIVGAKDNMTRRQWISLLEAVMRLGSVTHVLWLCDVNARLWSLARDVLGGKAVPPAEVIQADIVCLRGPYLAYANPAVPRIREQAALYLNARLGLNLLMWHLAALEIPVKRVASCSDLHSFLLAVSEHRSRIEAAGFQGEYAAIRDQEARALACKKGIGTNIVEFCRYALGQRQTANEALRGYDQGYVLRKRGQHASAPWVVSLGPVSVLALVHCCLRESVGPRSVQRLSTHLSCYGLEVDRDDIATSDLGRQLRMLGLVLDSPDAETGMLLVPPFDVVVES